MDVDDAFMEGRNDEDEDEDDDDEGWGVLGPYWWWEGSGLARRAQGGLWGTGWRRSRVGGDGGLGWRRPDADGGPGVVVVVVVVVVGGGGGGGGEGDLARASWRIVVAGGRMARWRALGGGRSGGARTSCDVLGVVCRAP